jgi:hypothetical protein
MAEWKALGAVFYCLISLTLSIIFVAGGASPSWFPACPMARARSASA